MNAIDIWDLDLQADHDIKLSMPTVGPTLCLGYPTKRLAHRHRVLVMPQHSCDEHDGATLLGFTTRPCWVARKCSCNALNALVNRHGVEPPPVVDDDWSWFFEGFCRPYIASRLWCFEPSFDRVEWLKRWSRVKREQIFASECSDPIKPSSLQVMIKRECYHKPPSKPRLIQYYTNLATQAEFAPEFAAFQKSYSAWVSGREVDGVTVTFASGMNGVQLGEWMTERLARHPRGVFYERDGEHWDATMQSQHLSLVLPIYQAIHPGMARFVAQGFHCTAVCRIRDTALIYRILGTVKSGHNDTTSRNSLVNAAIAASVARSMRMRADILVAGDDLLLISHDDFDADEFARLESRRGIVPSYRKFHHFSHVSFISGAWLHIGQSRHLFVPLLGRLLARLWWTVNAPPPRGIRNYRHSVVAGLSTLVGDIPVYREFLRRHDEGGQIVPVDKGHRFIAPEVRVDVDEDACWESLCLRYRVSRPELEELVAIISQSSHPRLYRDRTVRAIELVDLAKLEERELGEI